MNGVSKFWRDDNYRLVGLNWRSNWTEYGINTVMFSDYWKETSPKTQER